MRMKVEMIYSLGSRKWNCMQWGVMMQVLSYNIYIAVSEKKGADKDKRCITDGESKPFSCTGGYFM